MMNRKIIFLDCDGTLFDVPRGMTQVSNKTRYAIQELIKSGHLVFIASGRSKCLLPKDIVDLNPTGFITANGAYAFTKDEEIFRTDMKEFSVDAIIKYCNEHNGVYYLETQDYIATRNINNPLHKEFVGAWDVDRTVFRSDDICKDKYQLLMAAFNSKEECDDFVRAMIGIVDVRHQYGFNSFDISDFGLDKGDGVRQVLKYYGMDKKDAYAFGDGLNDIEMLEEVEESYAVANARKEVLNIAKHIALDVLEDGFYDAMVKVGLIKPIE